MILRNSEEVSSISSSLCYVSVAWHGGRNAVGACRVVKILKTDEVIARNAELSITECLNVNFREAKILSSLWTPSSHRSGHATIYLQIPWLFSAQLHENFSSFGDTGTW